MLDWHNLPDHVAHEGDIIEVWGREGEWVVTSIDPKKGTTWIRDFGGTLVPEYVHVTLEKWDRTVRAA